MNREVNSIFITFSSLYEMAALAGYFDTTAKLLSSPQVNIDQLSVFHTLTISAICKTQVLNKTEMSPEKLFRVLFERESVVAVREYIANTIQLAKESGCTEEHIMVIQELVKLLS